MAVIYVLCLEAQTLAKKQSSFSLFYYAIRPQTLFSIFTVFVYGKRSFLSKESDTLGSYRVYISPTM